MDIIAEGLGNISGLPQYETQFKEGDSGELRVYLKRNLYQDEMDELSSISLPIAQDARILSIKFRKESSPLAVIAGVLVLIAGIIIGWQLFKVVAATPIWAWVIGGGIYLLLLRRRKWLGKR